MNKFAATSVLSLVTATLLASCATYTGQTNDPNDPNRTRNGALIGAGIGAVASLLSGGDAVERRQRCDGRGGRRRPRRRRDRRLTRIARKPRCASAWPAPRAGEPRGDNIALNMPGNITFAFNSSNLDPKFYPVPDGVAKP